MASKSEKVLPRFPAEGHDNYLTIIDEHLAGIKEELQGTISGNLTLLMETLDHTTHLSKQVGRVSQELHDIRSRVSDPQNSLFAVVVQTTKRRRALIESERHTGVMITVLESLVHVKKELEALQTLIQQQKLASSIQKLVHVQNLISTLPGPFTPDNEPVIYSAVKQRFVKLHQELVDLLEKAYLAAFRIDSANHAISVTIQPDTQQDDISDEEFAHPLSLATSLALLHMLDRSQTQVAHLELSIRPFIDAFLVEPTSTTTSPHLMVQIDGREATLINKSTSTSNSQLRGITTSLQNTSVLLEFLAQYFIDPWQRATEKLQRLIGNGDLKETVSTLALRFGSSLLPYLVERLVTRCFEHYIPEQRAQLSPYQRAVEKEVDIFLPQLQRFSWLPSTQTSLQPTGSDAISTSTETAWNVKIFDFLKNAHLHFANKKRRILLAKARSLLLSGQYTSQLIGETEYGGSEQISSESDAAQDAPSLFKFPECRVRDVVIELVEIGENLVEEAFKIADENGNGIIALMPPSLSELQLRMILLETAKDIFDLYRSIVPSVEMSKIVHIPQLSMLFHNDCQYIAHHIAMLNSTYRIHLGHSRQEYGTLSNMSASHPQLGPLVAQSSTTTDSKRSRSNLRTASATAIPYEVSVPAFVSFVDLVASFRSFAEQFYCDILAGVKEHLVTLLGNTDRLRSTHHDERKKKVLVVMRHIVSELQNKDRNWSDTLPRELHKVTMGGLVNTVVEWMIGVTREISDIAAEESDSLYDIFASLFPLAMIFTDPLEPLTIKEGSLNNKRAQSSANGHSDAASSSTDRESDLDHGPKQRMLMMAHTKASCARYVKSWLVYEDLADAFKMRMVEIVDRFNSGQLHFTRSETEALIKALFEMGPKRNEQIAALRND